MVHPDHEHTSVAYTIQHFLHAVYFRHYNNYTIEENYNYKVMVYFLSPNILLLFVFFLNKQILCCVLSNVLSNEAITHQFTF